MDFTLCQHRRSAFTLVELLVVMAVMTTLLTMATPVLKSLGGATGLVGAGNEVDGILTLARQNSISRGVLTAVVVLADPTVHDGDAAYRTLTVLELAPHGDGTPLTSSDWRQVDRWHVLPGGVTVDANPGSAGVPNSSFLRANTIKPDLPALKYKSSTFQPVNGSNAIGYYCQVFGPDGRVFQAPSPCTLRLAEGYYAGGSSVYTDRGSNFYNLICNDATGEVKITRP